MEENKGIAPATKTDFNPAALVYRDDEGNKVLNLDAKLAWFYATKPGWKITFDGLKVIGLEVYVNNTYASADNPEEHITKREKETVYVAVGLVSMVDDKGVRVATVPMNIDAMDRDFCGTLFEDGAEFLLEMNGFNIYNITAEQWAAAMETRIRAARAAGRVKPQAGQAAAGELPEPETGGAAPSPDDFFDQFVPNEPPLSAGLPSGSKPFDFEFGAGGQEDIFGRPVPGDVFDDVDYDGNGSEISIANVMKLFAEFNKTRSQPCAPEEMQQEFERYCIYKKGGLYNEMNDQGKYEVVDSLKKEIASAKGGRR